MRPSRPRSIATQLTLLLILAVIAAQVPASLTFAFQSTRVGRVAFTARIGDRVAALVHVLSVLPADLQPQAIKAYRLPSSDFSLDTSTPIALEDMDADDVDVAQTLARRLRYQPEQVRVRLDDYVGALSRYVPWRATPKMLRVSVHLANGNWLNARARVVLPDTPLWLQIGLLQLGAAIVAILVTLGFGLRIIIRPVTALADAAGHLGLGGAIAPLPERGPRELRSMTASFNTMQLRLRAFVDDRTRMLAAISHDLRTPLSSLWLRAEMVDDPELRGAMVRTLAEMKHLVESTLTFARDDAVQERGQLDLAQLARDLADQHRALGQDVSYTGPAEMPFTGRTPALRRALDNLVENAVRYGERARLTIFPQADAIHIRVDDDGPGLPPDRIDDMFEPFVRLDDARNGETGGTGLGLAIARSAIREHGGDVVLVNQPVRGLRAEVRLPL